MRRKSERTATKKAKPSPEKKVEKVKRTRSKRKKQSTSSDNDSADEVSPAQVEVVAKVEEPPKPPKTPVKEDSPEEAQDQVWQVKAAEGSRDTGEIQKLKICLTRPPSTPERAERSPRSKRKFSRATSSSDATSVEASEEKDKKKTRRSKRSHRESNDELDKSHDSQGEELEVESASQSTVEEVTQSEAQSKEKSVVESSENTITTSDENVESKSKKDKVECSEDVSVKAVSEDKESKQSDADTTVVSPQVETTAESAADPQPSTPLEQTKPEPEKDSKESQNDTQENKNDTQESPKDAQDSKNESQESKNDNQESQNESKDSQNDSGDSQNETQESHNDKTEKASPERRRSMSVDKSEILELHPEESKCESDTEADKSKTEDTKEEAVTSVAKQVSKFEEKAPIKESDTFNDKHTNVTGIVESSDSDKKQINHDKKDDATERNKQPEDNQNKLERSDSTQSHQDESLPNGQAAPIVVSRKRRWGSRPFKITTQKTITISTDLLKDIIPDVKPVEFDEVLEEKKHKREVTEKIERPVLPKIVIDNTENVDRNHDVRKEQEDKDRHVIKPKESHLAVNRKISIINDNDTVIKPPSPPRHKQSSVLYITNLVRPFTLPQLKNLLQRTGKIVENGFWIDKIKSKCYVVYEKEDQAIETRHALHGVTWPVSNPKTLQVDFSTQEAFEKAKNEETDNIPVSTMGGTVEDWLREQDQKRQRGELEKPWERKSTREWDLGKNENDKEKEKRRDEKPPEKRRHRSIERSPEPARKFKKKEEEAPAKLLDDLFKKTKTTPCIYWLPLSAETIAIKEEQRRQHMAEHERRMLEQRRPHRRH